MSHNTSYPSPTAAQVGDGAGPFYTSQQSQRLPTQEELDLGVQLEREINPSIQNNNGQHDMNRADQKYSQQIMYTPQTHQQLAANPGPPPNNTMNNGEDSAAKKKAKVSRACDECRRKKIRCDADGEGPGHKKCSNCVRTQASCEFSRIPMKRGPSKGVDMDRYIKELSDRVDSLEALRYEKLGLGSNHSSPHGVNDFDRPHDLGYGGRKRTHSVSEHGYLQTQLQHTPDKFPNNGNWSTPEVSYAPQTYGRQAPFAEMSYNSAQKPAMSSNGVHQAPSSKDMSAPPVELDSVEEELLAAYLVAIHPTFPLLGGGSSHVRASLGGCSNSSREALFSALCAALRYIVPGLDRNFPTAEENALKVLQNVQSANISSRNYHENMIYLQTVVLMVLSIDNFGPPSAQPSSAPSRGVWFGLAMELAEHLKLPTSHIAKSDNSLEATPTHPDIRRVWWTMIVIDRYHASGTANAQQISDSVAELIPSDEHTLGEVFYHQARLSYILVRLSQVFVLPAENELFFRAFKNGLASDVKVFRESFQLDLVDKPAINVPYWHIKLLFARVVAGNSAPSSDIVIGARTLVDLILKNPWSPFTHYFVTLAAKTLIEIADFKVYKAEALEGLQELVHGIESRPFKVPWDMMMLDAAKSKLQVMEKGSLQNLADAAVGESDDKVMDWATLTHQGYLNAFGEAA